MSESKNQTDIHESDLLRTGCLSRQPAQTGERLMINEPRRGDECILPNTARSKMLADIAESGDPDNAEVAAADLAREFPHPVP